jgi:AbrB family looped-hinge helix DNA binding protein
VENVSLASYVGSRAQTHPVELPTGFDVAGVAGVPILANVGENYTVVLSKYMGKTERHTIALGERGRLVLPAQLRRRLDLHPGDRLIVTVDTEGGLRVISARDQAERLRGLYRELAPGRSLAEELIAERREEAGRGDPR